MEKHFFAPEQNAGIMADTCVKVTPEVIQPMFKHTVENSVEKTVFNFSTVEAGLMIVGK